MPLPGHWGFPCLSGTTSEHHGSVLRTPSIVTQVLLLLPLFSHHGGEESSREVTDFSIFLDRQEDSKGEFASYVSNLHIKLSWKQETDNVSDKLRAS